MGMNEWSPGEDSQRKKTAQAETRRLSWDQLEVWAMVSTCNGVEG